jgi:hypothetical protein
MSRHMRVLIAVLLAIIGLACEGCTPNIVKEPYKVTEVREVYRPIPDEYTRQLETPTLPDTITVLDLVNYAKAWQAWGRTANEHRGAVKKLVSPGSGS